MMSTPLLSRFAVMSDLHFMAWLETNEPVEWVPSLYASLEDAYAQKPDFVVVNGDLTNGKERDYKLAMPALRQHCPVPVYFTMGNHEYYGLYEDESFGPEAAHKRFLEYTGSPSIHQVFTIANRTFIFLSTERYTPDLKDSGWLTTETLDWLRAEIDKALPGPIFVFFHQPVNHTVANSEFTCWQSDELRAILEPSGRVLFFTGHTHCRADRPDQLVLQNKVAYVGGGCLCNETPQTRFVEVYEDHIRVRIRDHHLQSWNDHFETVIHIRQNTLILA